jgi:hypothetical protein
MYMYNEKYANDYGINGTTKSVSTVRIKEVKTQIWTTRIKKKSLMQILKIQLKIYTSKAMTGFRNCFLSYFNSINCHGKQFPGVRRSL